MRRPHAARQPHRHRRTPRRADAHTPALAAAPRTDKLSLERYRELAEKAWPTEAFAGGGGAAAPTLAEAEVAFWSQMVSNVPQNGANGTVPVGLDAGKVRAEAEVYQRRVQEAQATGGKSREGSLSARVLVQIPWELQGAPPVMSRPASAPRPDPRPPPAAPVPRPFAGGLSPVSYTHLTLPTKA